LTQAIALQIFSSSPLLKPITLKLERAAVFADGADGALVKALWSPGADLQRDLDGTGILSVVADRLVPGQKII
jgi:hypothetical protein